MVSGDDFPMPKAPAGTARRRIVAGARRHFFAHGFRGVTMDDLAAELGMSKKTLYAHFAKKTALVEAVLLDKFQDIEEKLQSVTAACSASFEGAMNQFYAGICLLLVLNSLEL